MDINKTIIALSTASGGAIAVIRLSGEDAILISDQIFTGKKKLVDCSSHTVHFGKIWRKNELIDEVLVSVFKNPNTFTGENLVEISCHGSNYIIQSIIDIILSLGAELAKPGEFTQRAFLNGKLDLTQAEAVADLIASESASSHRIALNQMRGGISSELAVLREELVNFTALIELELDFGEEDVEFADRSKLLSLTQVLKSKISKLVSTFHYGNAIKNGVPVAIIGKPNAGKSSLLNTILNEDRAIVSDIAGTTRDTIEETWTIDGIQFRFIDTAGLRETSDEVESRGIEKAREKIVQSQIVIYLFDKNEISFDEICTEVSKIPEDKMILICQSKLDLSEEMNWAEIEEKLRDRENFKTLSISIQDEESIQNLKTYLVTMIREDIDDQSVIISNSRHHDSLTKALDAILEVESGLKMNISGDLLSPHLREALRHIGDITGEIDIDKDILGTIFGKFCIGK